MSEIIDAIRNDSLLQAISIIVALLTAVYYSGKALLFLGKNGWRKLSPALGHWLDKRSADRAARARLALTDPVFLIAEVSRRFLLPLSFLIMYFVLLIGGVADGDDLNPPAVERIARNILVGAGSFQIGSLAGWLTAIAKMKLDQASEGESN